MYEKEDEKEDTEPKTPVIPERHKNSTEVLLLDEELAEKDEGNYDEEDEEIADD